MSAQEFPAELVERVARAICAAEGDDWNREGKRGLLPAYRPLALAALRALRDAGALVGPDQVAVPRKDVADIAGNVRDIRRMLAAAPQPGGTK